MNQEFGDTIPMNGAALALAMQTIETLRAANSRLQEALLDIVKAGQVEPEGVALYCAIRARAALTPKP